MTIRGVSFFGISCLLTLTTFPFIALSQSPKNDYIIDNYYISKGLSNNQIQSIIQDYDGFIWIGTTDGLNRFDGRTFKIYRHIPNQKHTIGKSLINYIYQGRDSTIWVGTRGGGLSRYNRKTDNFTSFQYNKNNPKSISHDEVFVIYEDDDNNLWIGTDGGGLNKFDRKTETFVRFQNDPNNPKSLRSNKVLSIADDKRGNLWLGTWDGQINIFNKKTGTFSFLDPQVYINGGIENCNIWTMQFDTRNTLWMGLINKKLCRYNINENKLYGFDFKDKLPFGLNKYSVRALLWDSDSAFWVSTNLGLFRSTCKVSKHGTFEPVEFQKICDAQYFTLVQAYDGSIWAGTFDEGLAHIYKRNNKFEIQNIVYPPNISPNQSNPVNCMYSTSPDQIYLGTLMGYFIFNPLTGQYKYPQNKSPLLNYDWYVRSFYSDTEGELWSGKAFELTKYNPATQTFDHFFSLPAQKEFSFPQYRGMVHDDDKRFLWIATDIGLIKLNLTNKSFKMYIGAADTYEGKSVYHLRSISKDKDGNLLIATYGCGLIVFNTKTHKSTYYLNNPNNPNTISNNFVEYIFKTLGGDYWIGTYGGLNYFDRKNNKFVSYTTKHGLPSDLIYAMLEDEKNNLWVSSSNGLSKFNPKTKSFTNYFFYDQAKANTFVPRSCWKDPKGKMYFGRIDGFLSFYPDSIRIDTIIPKIIFTDIKLFNESLKVENGSPLNTNVADAKLLTLNHKQSSISFEFIVLDYIYPEASQYSYKLNGFDKDWIKSGNKNFANYTNLPPGRYVFNVKAANHDGIWNNKGIQIEIIITPPFWATWSFRIALVLIIFLSLVYWYRNKIKKFKKTELKLEKLVRKRTSQLSELNVLLEEQKEELEQQQEEVKSQRDELINLNKTLEVQKREIENQNNELQNHRQNLETLVHIRTQELEIAKKKAEESDQLKSAFLANMSHEIRTPLNAIVGFASLLDTPELTPESQEMYNNIIQSNANDLLVLIDDILDLSKIEAGQIEIKPSAIKVNFFIQQVFETFSKNSGVKEVEIRTTQLAFNNNFFIFADPLRLKQIFNNLLSNAIKFTQHGFIEIGILPPENGYLTFYVKDTGIGISSDHHHTIFDHFRKIESESTVLYRGTGLGLAITQQLVNLMGGKIWLESTLNKGSTFFFTIPLSDTEAYSSLEETTPNGTNTITPIKKILIVDDIEVNYSYLYELLKSFKSPVIWARDGYEAIDIVRNTPEINLILMDIKLPGINGIETMAEIKKINSSIPVIAQTAYALNEEKNEFMKAGFAGYITKPIKKTDLWEALKNCEFL